MSPSGSVPVLHCGDFVVSEPTPIISFIKQKVSLLNFIMLVKDFYLIFCLFILLDIPKQ